MHSNQMFYTNEWQKKKKILSVNSYLFIYFCKKLQQYAIPSGNELISEFEKNFSFSEPSIWSHECLLSSDL